MTNERVPHSLQTSSEPGAADFIDPGSPDEIAAIHVDRARTELRHGRPIAVLRAESEHEPVGSEVLLAASVETLSPSRIRSLARNGRSLRLLLTAERIAALGLGPVDGPMSYRVPRGVNVEQLQLLAAAAPGGGDVSLLGDPRAATSTMRAALLLIKRAQLTPSLVVTELPAAELPRLQEEQVLHLAASDAERLGITRAAMLRRISDAHVPIAASENTTLVLFREIDGDSEHVAIIIGQPDLSAPVPVRLHSSCLTGDLLGSLRCDCGDQLRSAIDHLSEAGGVLLYLSQEGRGTGLANKLRAYRLQDGGLDTLQADRYLGFRDDERDFSLAGAMLKALGIARVNLLTNNPRKIEVLKKAGIDVVERVPLLAPLNSYNERYVRTKHEFAGHLGREDEQA